MLQFLFFVCGIGRTFFAGFVLVSRGMKETKELEMMSRTSRKRKKKWQPWPLLNITYFCLTTISLGMEAVKNKRRNPQRFFVKKKRNFPLFLSFSSSRANELLFCWTLFCFMDLDLNMSATSYMFVEHLNLFPFLYFFSCQRFLLASFLLCVRRCFVSQSSVTSFHSAYFCLVSIFVWYISCVLTGYGVH